MKQGSISKRGQQEDKTCACEVSSRMFIFVLLYLCLIVLINLLATDARLSSIANVSTNLINTMHQFIKERNYIFTNFYDKNTSEIARFSWKTTEKFTSTHVITTTRTTTKMVVTTPIKRRTPRPDACRSCFVHNFKYLIDNPNICNSSEGKQEKIDIIILIFTTHVRRLNRDTIRETWISDAKNNTANIRYAFLLGYTSNKTNQAEVEKENEQFHDIIQEDFIDSYHNLTYKTMMAFKWAVTKCAHARFVMKTDDDMYINTKALLSVVSKSAAALQKNVGGACHKRAQPIRSPSSKWYASPESYPRKWYPGFCSGTGYVTSITLARRVFDISKDVPFFHLEDVFVALCVRKLKLSLLPIRGFNSVQVKPHGCNYKKNSVVTSHYMTPDLVKRIWSLKC
ncbi:hypothetical protein FSP39_003257 [Pinctada imbricata]|uniref:Hexosyltransferase n=1 Tax=Pinctada imbricata TaxID=66713 RepID=A0AA88YJM1_PINIB|nr:hypothetical protein FSP39_003257 [Pinctada imbricata]